MKITLPLLALTAIVSCAPAPEIKRREPLFKTTENLVVLSEKADKEVIISKYKSEIRLNCHFYVSNEASFNIDLVEPQYYSRFSVNIAAGEVPFNFLAKLPKNESFTTGVRVADLDILPEVEYNDKEGNPQVMRNVPVVTLLVRGRVVNGKKDERFEKRVTINEMKGEEIRNLYPEKYPHKLNCSLKVNVAEGYDSDYPIVVPEKEQTPAEETPAAPSITEETPVEVSVSEQKPEETPAETVVID